MSDDRPADAGGFETLDRRIALEFDRYVTPIRDATPSSVIADVAMARRRGILTGLRLVGLPVPELALRLAALAILLLAAMLAAALLAGHRTAPAVFLGTVAVPVENGDGTESVALVDGTGTPRQSPAGSGLLPRVSGLVARRHGAGLGRGRHPRDR